MAIDPQTIGHVHSLESFGLVDGPGVRFVVFLQGCRMRCQYCHNPETWTTEGGTDWTAQALFQRVWRYRNYWGKQGGVTVSGGEPLLQLDFLTAFFALAKEKGVHTVLDTAGNPFTRGEPFFSRFRQLMEVTDLVMLDLKQTDPAAHKALTGWDNDNILDMARYLSDTGKPMWVRRVLVPGLTDDPAELTRLKAFLDSLNTVERVEILPYHTLGTFKWDNLGIPYPLEGVPTPTEEQVAQAEALLGIEKD
ncbi:MAG: pyruvate formate lyase-activating protein [Clostridiales bacterium]|nr:pyruvate formate lyase-activating protein [Clostridiales bacterium]